MRADGCAETRSLTMARAWLAGRGVGMAEAVASAPVTPRAWELDVAAELMAAAQGDDEVTLRARLERLAAQLRGRR